MARSGAACEFRLSRNARPAPDPDGGLRRRHAREPVRFQIEWSKGQWFEVFLAVGPMPRSLGRSCTTAADWLPSLRGTDELVRLLPHVLGV